MVRGIEVIINSYGAKLVTQNINKFGENQRSRSKRVIWRHQSKLDFYMDSYETVALCQVIFEQTWPGNAWVNQMSINEKTLEHILYF